MLTLNRKLNSLWVNDDVNVSIKKDLDGKYILVNMWNDSGISSDNFFRCPVEAAKFINDIAPTDISIAETTSAITSILDNC